MITTPESYLTTLQRSASQEATGSVLLAERNKVQKPIYFFSKVLQDVQVNIPPLEKLIFALLLSSWRFKRQSVKGEIMAEFLAKVDMPATVTIGKKSTTHTKPTCTTRKPGLFTLIAHQARQFKDKIRSNHDAKHTVSIGQQLHPTVHKPMIRLKWPTEKLSRALRKDGRIQDLLGGQAFKHTLVTSNNNKGKHG
ncbi:reverse transcriptase domain-containing protein [Tanacetum coccineum]